MLKLKFAVRSSSLAIKMEFKLFILCTVFLVLTVSASSSPQKQHSVAKFTFKMSENGTDYDEEVDIDEEEETETFHVPKVSPQKDSGDVIYDFKKNLTMVRVTEAKACFLRKSTLGALKPSDLKQLLVQVTRNGLKVVPRTEVKLKVVSTIDDRSDLSDEMANLCAKLPIYEVTEGEVDPNDFNGGTGVGRIPAKRVKRGWLCRAVCGLLICTTACNTVCTGLLCNVICAPVCYAPFNRPRRRGITNKPKEKKKKIFLRTILGLIYISFLAASLSGTCLLKSACCNCVNKGNLQFSGHTFTYKQIKHVVTPQKRQVFHCKYSKTPHWRFQKKAKS